MPFFIIVTVVLLKSTLYFNLVNFGIERREYFVNVGITCPTVAAGGSKGSRRLAVWLLRVLVLFGMPTRIPFVVVCLLSHIVEGVSIWVVVQESTMA